VPRNLPRHTPSRVVTSSTEQFVSRALTRAASFDSGRPHAAAAVRVVADYTLSRRTAYCDVYYHYHYCSPMRTSLNASTARRHVPPSRVVTPQLRAALATQRAAQSFQFNMSVAKHQACFTTKLQKQNLATFSHSAVTPIAYLQHTPTKHALITR